MFQSKILTKGEIEEMEEQASSNASVKAKESMLIKDINIDSPMVLTAEQFNQSENYLFSEQLDKIITLCDDLKNREAKPLNKNYNIIGIVGERGSGKSSVLGTAKALLQTKGYYVLNIIDPNVFDDSLNLIEIFITTIYNEMKPYKNETFTNKDNIELNNKLAEISTVLADVKGGKSNFYRDNSTFDIVSAISERIDLSTKINDLIELFIKCKNNSRNQHEQYSKLIIMIDDMDLINTKYIYSALEDLRKYLCEKAIVIVAYRSEQILNAVIDKKTIENKNVLDLKYIDSEEIRNQAIKYLEKLFSFNSIIYLYSAQELYKKSQYSVLNAIDSTTSKVTSLQSCFFEEIYRKTRIQLEPVDEREDNQYVLPNNLRGILQLYYAIKRMNSINYSFDGKDVRKEISKILLENIAILKNYIKGFYVNALDNEDKKFFITFDEVKDSDKNYFVWKTYYNKVKDYNKAFDDTLENLILTQKNVQLGDVFGKIEQAKDMMTINDYDIHVIYLIKVLYSIELLQQYLNYVVSVNEENLENYLILLNGKIIPDNFYYMYPANSTFKDNWGVLFYKNYNEIPKEVLVDKYDNVIKSIVYSQFTSKSRIYLKERKLNNEIEYTKYVSLFEETEQKLPANKNYYFDPFSFLCKKAYIKNSVTNNYYVLYSLFDIDCILRIRFGDAGRKDKISKIAEVIGFILGNKTIDKNAKNTKLINEIKTNIFGETKVVNNFRLFSDDKYYATLEFVLNNLTIAYNEIENFIKTANKGEFVALLKQLLSESSLTAEIKNGIKNILERLKIPNSRVYQKEKEFIVELVPKYRSIFEKYYNL